jgi:hypothetical protein
VFDVAGNKSSGTAHVDQIYDITRPTISEITTSEGADAIRKKTDDYVEFTVVFTEDVKGTNSLTVTFETSTVDGQDGTGTAPYQNLAAWANTAVDEKVGRFQVSTDDLSTDLSINSPLECSGTITDLAGNEMEDFTVPDGKNLNDVAEIIVDGENPSITKVESEPSIGTLIVADWPNDSVPMEGSDSTFVIDGFSPSTIISATSFKFFPSGTVKSSISLPARSVIVPLHSKGELIDKSVERSSVET